MCTYMNYHCIIEWHVHQNKSLEWVTVLSNCKPSPQIMFGILQFPFDIDCWKNNHCWAASSFKWKCTHTHIVKQTSLFLLLVIEQVKAFSFFKFKYHYTSIELYNLFFNHLYIYIVSEISLIIEHKNTIKLNIQWKEKLKLINLLYATTVG